MAKTIAPLLSFGAGGQIGRTMVMSKWRGIKYSRQYVVPANPRTAAQQLTRTTFALLREMWKIAPQEQKAPWDAFATGRPFLGFNKYIGENLRVLRSEPDFDNFIGSPGARGGLPLQGMALAATATPGELLVTLDAPDLPDDWLISRAVAVGFTNQDPSGFFAGPYVSGVDAAAPYAITLTGLESGVEAVVSAWLEFTKPDGTTAYGVSLTDTATPL